MVLWDVFANADVGQERWRRLAQELRVADQQLLSGVHADILRILKDVEVGHCQPNISYIVDVADNLAARVMGGRFDLIYSHAALEHAWNPARTWEVLGGLTAAAGWHSHRIDLADHGSREGNYIEMLEWSDLSYWLTMRFVPGAINRWRSADHIKFLRAMGFDVVKAVPEIRPRLPVPRDRLAPRYRHMDDVELRTTAVDIVARRAN